jgi:hypothetical protein
MIKKLICVLCGHEWKNPYSNRCENENCRGFCSWGYELNDPDSFFLDENGQWQLKQPPTNEN